MFGWFAPRSPLETAERAWVETRFAWLATVVGIDTLRRVKVLLPTADDFPGDYHGTGDEAYALFTRLCQLYGIDPGTLDFDILPDESMPNAAGHYDDHGTRPIIRVRASQVASQVGLVATLGHELAHHWIFTRSLLTRDVDDLEWVTDLTPIAFGLGVFTANATIEEARERMGNWSRWQMQRHGYLPSRMIGYGLALLAWTRQESSPDWANFLRLDAGQTCKDALRYLEKGGECLFDPLAPHHHTVPKSRKALIHVLESGSPAARLTALWGLSDESNHDRTLVEAVGRQLQDREPSIVLQALDNLGRIGPAAAGVLPEILQGLRHKDELIRRGAAAALGRIQPKDPEVISGLIERLDDDSEHVRLAAVESLLPAGTAAASAEDRLLDAFRQALNTCNEALVAAIIATLDSAVGDGEARVREAIADDPELLRLYTGENPDPPEDDPDILWEEED